MAERKNRKAWRRGAGGVRKNGDRWYIRYSWNGKRHEEPTGARSRKEAEAILRNKLTDLDKGRVSVEAHKTRVRNLFEPIQINYKIKGQRGEVLPRRWKHLEPVFGNMLAREVTYYRMETYMMHRGEQGAAPSTIQKEIACLRRMFRLGAMSGTVAVLPIFPSIHVDNARQVFWTYVEYCNIVNEVPDYLKPIVILAYWTGCRLSELLSLDWRHVDLETGRMEFERGTTKNKEFKTIYLPGEALKALREWRKTTEDLMAHTHTIIAHVFHRQGKRLARYDQFRTAWDNARARLGYSEKGFHDFRRSLTRQLRDAGVDDITSMKITGHKTRTVFDQYNIRNEADVKNAAEKLSRLAQQG